MSNRPLTASLPPLGSLRAFEAAARHSSFTDAAEELNVSQAAVSQHVRSLEHNLRSQLFDRTPRGLKLTESGECYLPVIQDVLQRLGSGTERLFGDRNQRSLTIKMISTLAIAWLGPRLGSLRDAFRNIDIEIMTFQWNAETSVDYVDLEIRYGSGAWTGMASTPLVQEHLVPVCSPELAKQLNEPIDLLEHPLFHIVGTSDAWQEWLKLAGIHDTRKRMQTRLDSSLVAYRAVEQGAGVALGRTLLLEDQIRDGSLVAPFDLRLASRETYYLVRPLDARLDIEVDRLCEWLIAEAAATAARA